MNFCLSCAMRLKTALTQHTDLSLLDTDKIERRRKHREHIDRQLCYAALTNGYLEVALSIDPERHVNKLPGTKLLFTLEGKGSRAYRDAHHRLRESRAEELGNNFFEITEDVIKWIKEHNAETSVSNVREIN